MPLFAAVVTSAVVFIPADILLNSLTTWLHQKMAYLEFHDTALLGVFLGPMVCSGLGGMISKTDVAFGTVGVSGYDASKFSPIDMTIMAAVVAAGMVPPLALTLATLVRRTLSSLTPSAPTARPPGSSARPPSPRARSPSPWPTRSA